MRNSIYPLIILSSITFTGCSSVLNNLPGVYSLDIQQGNIINQEMIDQLRPKMTKRQVLYIMGSSMLIDVFHQKRWDYLYSEQPGGELRKQKRLSLFFDGDELIGVQGDFRPSTLPVIKESNETTVDVPPRDLEKTLWEKISGIFSDDAPNSINPITDEQAPKIKNIETDKIEAPAGEPSQEHIIPDDERIEPVNNNDVVSVTPLEDESPQIIENIQE